MHGPVAVLGPDHGLLAFAPPGPAEHGVLEAVDEARRRGAPALVAAPGADLDLVPMPEWLSPLGAVIPAQRLAADRRAERHRHRPPVRPAQDHKNDLTPAYTK